MVTANEADMSQWDTVAAVDLGSNSFHMIIARVHDGHVHVVDRLRDQVQLRAGLRDDGEIDEVAQARAIACLARFGERVHGIPQGKVRAVGTKTLRSAKNSAAFLAAAAGALGHPIEVISGLEEARLIYLGVAHSEADDSERRLVVDIGGGSTEFIIGRRFEAHYRESLSMGCVSASREYFGDGHITDAAMRRAKLAAHLELDSIAGRYRRIGWRDCIGSSGTIKAVQGVLVANQWTASGITPAGLERLEKALVRARTVERLQLDGLSRERAPVFAGGVAILRAAFDALGIEHMHASEGALREGLLYDHLGRIRHEDVRERTIRSMVKRYHVDVAFADRVARTALRCLGQVAEAWRLQGEENEAMLRWAAALHELGLAISHNQFHKHGAYLVQHSDMPGFSRQNQSLLSCLIRGQRRKFPKKALARLSGSMPGLAERLIVLLRLAVLLHHGRRERGLPRLRLVPGERSLRVLFPKGWLADHPLTRANLEQAATHLKAVKFKLSYE